MNCTSRMCLPLLVVCCTILAVGCGPAEEGNDTDFSGGSFTVTVEDVDDACFDGAMKTVILPDDEPVDLPDPVVFPAQADLPAETDITFNDPFQPADGVKLEASGDNGMQIAGEGIDQTDVDIKTGDNEECLTQLTIGAEVIATDDDNLTGEGVLTISEATGEDCPVFQNDPPCDVTTTISATRN